MGIPLLRSGDGVIKSTDLGGRLPGFDPGSTTVTLGKLFHHCALYFLPRVTRRL